MKNVAVIIDKNFYNKQMLLFKIQNFIQNHSVSQFETISNHAFKLMKEIIIENDINIKLVNRQYDITHETEEEKILTLCEQASISICFYDSLLDIQLKAKIKWTLESLFMKCPNKISAIYVYVSNQHVFQHIISQNNFVELQLDSSNLLKSIMLSKEQAYTLAKDILVAALQLEHQKPIK